MASYEQLSAQERAIVDLIVKRGQSYSQLAEKLGMPEDRVREIAREALTGLAPVSAAAVDAGWRAQVADYLLGQQAAVEATATRGHLGRSEAARAWSRSVLDSLEHLYPKGELPEIPSAGTGEAPAAPTAAKAAPTGPLSPEAAAIVRRRRIAAIAGGVLVVLALALLVWPVGLLGGDDDSGEPAANGQGGGQAELVGQLLLEPVRAGSDAAGVALVTRTGDQFELALQAQVPPTKRNQAYEVWLFNSRDDAVSLGAQVTDDQGTFAGRASLPDNYEDYRSVDISRERVDRNAAHSGTSVLRGQIDEIQRPTEQQRQQQQQQQQQGSGDGSGSGDGGQ